MLEFTRQEYRNALIERHGEEIQQKLENACIGIAGLGGLGSHTAVFLARMGIGKLILADFDVVDVSNLNRQYYVSEHLGQPKTQALSEQLRKIHPWLECELHPVRITRENTVDIFGGCQILCEAFDRPDQKSMLIETALSYLPNTIVVSGNGMAGFESANKIKTTQKMKRLYICGDGVSDVDDGIGLMAPRVATCAAHEAMAVLRLLLGFKP